MVYFFIFIYMFLLPITIIYFLWRILDKLCYLESSIIKTKTEKEKTKTKRQHPKIEKSNYDNAYGGRKAYEKYQNKEGLYEPVTPSKGLKIKKKEE